MLDGDNRVLYTATIAQQPQVWTIKEHHYEPHAFKDPTQSPNHSPVRGYPHGGGNNNNHTTVPFTDKPVPPGPSLTAHLPRDVELVEIVPASEHPKSPLTSARRSPSSPSRSTISLPQTYTGPVLNATFTDPESGRRVRTSYATWSEGDSTTTNHLGDETAASFHHGKDDDDVGIRAESSYYYPQYRRARAWTDDSGGPYADPYGFSGVYAPHISPLTTIPSPSAAVNAEPHRMPEEDPRGGDEMRDIILTGKVRLSEQLLVNFVHTELILLCVGPFCLGPFLVERKGSAVGWYDQYRENICSCCLIFPWEVESAQITPSLSPGE